MDVVRVWYVIINPTSIIVISKITGNRIGSPFSGIQPISRKIIVAGSIVNASSPE